MSILLGEKIKLLRKEKGLSQEQLATQFGISVQAVSKWECCTSYPDIELLPDIADLFQVSIDFLLRDAKATNNFSNSNDSYTMLPNDNVFRIVQCQGNHILQSDECNMDLKIPLAVDKLRDIVNNFNNFEMEIWGSADIDGDIHGDVTAHNNINCGNVYGDLAANGNINCGNIEGDVASQGGVNCGNIEGDAASQGGINCGNIGGDVHSNKEINCGAISGDVECGSISCDHIKGDVQNCKGDIHCTRIDGDVSCSGDIIYMGRQE